MSGIQTILTESLIEWVYENSTVSQSIIKAPYLVTSFDNISDFSVSFLNKHNEWKLDCPDFIMVLFVSSLPVNHEEYNNVAFCVSENPRDLFAYLMDKSITRYDSWANAKRLSYISENAFIHSSAYIYDGVYISDGVEVGSNTSIGNPGFGFGRLDGEAYRLVHTGGVVIEKDTKIGSNSTVVSGTFKPTVLGRGVLIDDHVHVAHNCYVGDYSTLTAGAIMSGSVTLEEQNWLGPNSCIVNGTKLGQGTFVGIGAVVTKSFENGTVAGNPAKRLRG